MEEIRPGIFHWSRVHPDIHMRVGSYYVEPAGIVIDPLEPGDGMGFFDDLDEQPRQVVLTSGLHWRHSDRFRDRYDATIRAPATGMRRFEGTGREAEPYDFGDELAPGVTALEVGGICPDDTALLIDHGDGALAFADGLTRMGGTLGFVPDSLWDDPAAEQQAVLASLRALLAHRFDALLFAHGEPLAEGGRAALEGFLESPVVMPGLQ